MTTKISKTLRSWIGTAFIFMGLAVVTLGSVLVHIGAWLNDVKVLDVTHDDDLTDEELHQIIKEAREARGDKE